MNKAIITGRLTRDPDVRCTQGEGQTHIARFTLAVDRRRRKEGQKEADFISCAAFGKQAEFIDKYFRQGMKADVTGRIQTGSYTNRDGQKIYTTDVIVEDIEFGESKSAAQARGSEQRQQTPPPMPDEDGFMNIPDGIDDNLPFT